MGPKDQDVLSNEPEDEKVDENDEEVPMSVGLAEPISIFETMAMEKKLLGIESDEPLVVTVLLDKIRSLRGLQTEGIFRLSPDYNALQKFKNEVFRGVYTLEGVTDPHLPAELLKTWLRTLKEPVIPTVLYDDCLKIGQAFNASTGLSDNFREDFASLHQKFPPPTQKVLARISGFVEEATRQENAVTRMSVETFSILFAPGLMRSPSGDLMVQLANNSKESSFVAGLFQYLIEAHKSIDCGLDPAMLMRVCSSVKPMDFAELDKQLSPSK
eukprot:TRINITY_DN9569_c0_g1_i1.p1 TRINITY_DN9569_c0_g1~~TRINITY_DN9569_c0_g1_i1.p1  ORF type:complete len:315 (+),score=86.59 TRINITY_DN9569_c0_g1_i1:133-945(+)